MAEEYIVLQYEMGETCGVAVLPASECTISIGGARIIVLWERPSDYTNFRRFNVHDSVDKESCKAKPEKRIHKPTSRTAKLVAPYSATIKAFPTMAEAIKEAQDLASTLFEKGLLAQEPIVF